MSQLANNSSPPPVDVKLLLTRETRIGKRALVVVFILLLYVLSIGPVYRMAAVNGLSFKAMHVIYKPIYAITNTKIGERHIEPEFDWYIKLWLPKNDEFFTQPEQPMQVTDGPFG